ncbi:collagen alpha-1(I) chain-like [Sapajus apella]|uniref:Collagen alpha-1(I) chain-like n=1 Tax=Sapajus apella TaxID=9515 RepID=A0A6J3F905_SAPAP|nr:collagen alpha-1(I) chain-like [Sapajus apella]
MAVQRWLGKRYSSKKKSRSHGTQKDSQERQVAYTTSLCPQTAGWMASSRQASLPGSRALLRFCDAPALPRPRFAVGLSRRLPAARSAASQYLAGPGAGPGRGRQDGRRAPQRADHAGGLPLASREAAKVPPPSLALCPGRPAGISFPARPSAPGASRTFQARGHPDARTRPDPGAEGATQPRGETGAGAAPRLGTRGARGPRLLPEAAAWDEILAAAQGLASRGRCLPEARGSGAMDVATLPSSGQPAERHARAPFGGRGDVSTLCLLLHLKVGFVPPWFLLQAAKAALCHSAH